MGFLLSRRWALFALAVVISAWGAVALGDWQFHRLDERQRDNAIVGRNLDASPVPLQDVMSAERAPRLEDEWRRVTVRGTYDDEHTIVLKYQTRDSGPGVDVVTPLVTESGTAVLVDRGWMESQNSGSTRPELPAASDDPVTVMGYVRQDATGSSTRVGDLSTRAISSRAIGDVVPYDLFSGFLDLAAEAPRPDASLAAVELPDHSSNGPHFFYGLQWWFFGALAVFGFCYLAFDEFRRRRGGIGSDRPQHAAVDGEHHAGHER